MGKFSEIYKMLKKEDSQKIYLFKMGIFYNFMNEDASQINKLLGLQITPFGDDIKCGFPANNLNKYIMLLDNHNVNYKIIDNDVDAKNKKDYLHDIACINVIKEIEKINLNNITPIQAYEKLYEFQNKISCNKSCNSISITSVDN